MDQETLSEPRLNAATEISPTGEDIAQVVQAVFDDLDMRQLAIFRQLPGPAGWRSPSICASLRGR